MTDMDAEIDADAEATPDSNTVVALYEFDPSTIDWPFRRQRPLPLQTGRKIQVIHDDGSEWALGYPKGQPKERGYFPKNYTVSVEEYQKMMEDYEAHEAGSLEPAGEEEDVEEAGPPKVAPMPSVLPPMEDMGPIQPLLEDDLPEISIPGLANYPVLEPVPPIATTFEINKARLLREPPAVPRLRPMEPQPPADPIDRALLEVSKELNENKLDPRMLPGGMITDSRCSTPATHTLTRPERDFVRRHLPGHARDSKLGKLSTVRDVLTKHIRQAKEERPAYPVDLRVRATTCRIASGIEPGIMRQALYRAATLQAKWKQMFRPGFNDIVNESFKVGCNPCILSKLYMARDTTIKEQFQKIHIQDVQGTLFFELQRRKEHLFYMRMEGKDVMMCHPDAWGFPDTNRYVSAQPGEAFNPMHGWLHQVSINTDREMEDVEFSYTLLLRSFPENVFNALALGKIPKWIEPYTSLHGEASRETDKPAEEGGLSGDKALLASAGLEDGDDVFVKLDELRLARERTVGPDVLDARTEVFRLKGLNAMRVFYRSKGKPDNMKQSLLTPKIIKDQAAQLGIIGDHRNYWYCMFSLRYPLAPDWEVVIKNDTRWYLHLPTDRIQPVHPLIREFRQHLGDVVANDFLWDYRGFVRMKCSQCGIPDSVLWCMQCTDYFCVKCFHQTHKSKRGFKHWVMPTPGCRYLDHKEVDRMKEHLPLLNIGFSNRRRFLATDNQSDKMGSRTGDTWLYFHADSFRAALVQAPKEHWHVKRKNPPRLAPDQEGYYYNFEGDIIADDPSYIMMATHEQQALSLLQRSMRGALTRRRLKRETEAVVVIQKTKMMWDCLKVYSAQGKNANILKGWYRKYKAKKDRIKLEARISRAQAQHRGIQARNFVKAKLSALARFQAAFRGLRTRRHHLRKIKAVLTIQKYFRGHLHGRRAFASKRMREAYGDLDFVMGPRIWESGWCSRLASGGDGVRTAATAYSDTGRQRSPEFQEYLVWRKKEYHRAFKCKLTDGRAFLLKSCAMIQAMARGVAYREAAKRKLKATKFIQSHWRGFRGRKRVNLMHSSSRKLQVNWRRFRAQIDVKQILFTRMEELRIKRHDILLNKVQVAAAEIMQRGFRRYVAFQKYTYLKREKGDADKRTQTLIVAMFSAVGAMRQHVHPWWRHLPAEIQEVLEQIKNPMQRTIQNVPIQGKMANEEIGKRGLRVAHVSNLTYTQTGADPDLASHMFLGVTRHLLSLVPAELFPATVNWACYTISHKAVELSKKGTLRQDVIKVGKDMPPHPGDTLATLWDETDNIKSEVEAFIKLPEASLPLTVLHGLSPHHRQVYLTAEILITMRQALDTPSLSTEDHLKFQGLDVSAGAQLMEVIGSELDHSLPLEWPKSYGTVASLAAQTSTYVSELQPERVKGHGNIKIVKKEKGLADAVADAKKGTEDPAKDPAKPDNSPKAESDTKDTKKRGSVGGKSKSKAKAKPKPKAKKKGKKSPPKESDELGHLAHFNRKAAFRVVQQIGFLMRDQDNIVNAVLAAEEGDVRGQSVRTSRYISVAEKLFQMAESSKHDHCSFILSVVLFHMTLRGLLLRLMYHRAAISVQKRYRFLKGRGNKASQLAPAIHIQRFWRGLQAGLHCMKVIDAGKLIWKNYTIYRANKRSATLLNSILKIQRVWRGALGRQWLRHCNDAAVFIQKFVRKLLVRVVLDKPGRDVARKFQKEMNALLRAKDTLPESEFVARTSALRGKTNVSMAKQRHRNVEMRRALSFNLRSKHTRKQDREKMMLNVGRTQAPRDSVFEPMVFGMARLQPDRLPARIGCKQSKILKQVSNAMALMDKSLPKRDSDFESRGPKQSWVCSHRLAGTGDTICKTVNPAGMKFCRECGKKQYNLPHASTLRGRAAVIAMRLAKTPRMADSKTPLVHPQLCVNWAGGMFQPTG